MDLANSYMTMWKAMIQGDYEIEGHNEFYFIFIKMIFVLMPHVILLNLTVAILGDSYEENITLITEKELKE